MTHFVVQKIKRIEELRPGDLFSDNISPIFNGYQRQGKILKVSPGKVDVLIFDIHPLGYPLNAREISFYQNEIVYHLIITALSDVFPEIQSRVNAPLGNGNIRHEYAPYEPVQVVNQSTEVVFAGSHNKPYGSLSLGKALKLLGL